MKDDTHEFWAVPLGAGLLVCLIGCLALVAGGGWNWFAGFLTSSASGWAQAVGTVLAILATARIARADQLRRDEQELVLAEFTASKVSAMLQLFAPALLHFVNLFLSISVTDHDPQKFPGILDELKTIKVDITEEQLVRLAAVPKPVTHDIIDAIGLHGVAVNYLEGKISNPANLKSSAARKEYAAEAYRNLVKAFALADSAQKELNKFLERRGVTIHDLNPQEMATPNA